VEATAAYAPIDDYGLIGNCHSAALVSSRGSVDWVAGNWQEPESGLWEVRAGHRNFVYGKVMCWVALDRAIDMAEALDLPGDIEHWRAAGRAGRDAPMKRLSPITASAGRSRMAP